MKKKIDIEWGEVDIYVDGQKVLEIGQVSDNDTVNLFLSAPGGHILQSMISGEDPTHPCTHEVITERVERKKGQKKTRKQELLDKFIDHSKSLNW